MSTGTLIFDNLSEPISQEQPAGTDLRWTPEWDRLKEARRADDNLDPGQWARKDRKAANWPLVHELAAEMLRERTKDLQIAMWLTEADLKLYGFSGLRDGLRLCRELLVRYWDTGLFPSIEDGPEDRSGPFQWLSDKLTDSIVALCITARSDDGDDYSLIQLQEARRVGSEASWTTSDGEIDDKRRKEYLKALEEGRISMEMFERAVKNSPRADIEALCGNFNAAHNEFRQLETIIDEKFGDAAPNLSLCRAAMREIGQELSAILERKQLDEPNIPVTNSEPEPSTELPAGAIRTESAVIRLPLPVSTAAPLASAGLAGTWSEAEMLIRAGEVEKGLAEMTRLAAADTCGRSRFQRKLLLAEVCLGSGRERLARSVLEELAEQIDKFQLENWESTELIGSVWTRLYKLYRKSGQGSADADRAGKLYERLCRLDPWQALACSEV